MHQTNSRFGRFYAFITAIAFISLFTIPAAAVENGITAYPPGLETSYSAVVPDPGTTQLNFYLVGMNSSNLVGNGGKSEVPDFDLNAEGFAFRIWHTWGSSVYGFHFSTGVSPVFETKNITVDGNGFNSSSANEIMIEPFDVSTQIGTVSLFAGELFYLPIGQHTPSNLASTSIGYTTLVSSVAATWFPNPRWQVSGWLTYGHSLEDHLTQYQSGNYVDFDYGASYRPFIKTMPKLAVGVNGFFLKQISDDTISNVQYNDGNRVQVFAIGPSLEWDFTPTTAVIVKFQHDLAVRNTAVANTVWVMFSTPI